MPTIKELIQKLSREGLEIYSLPCKVTAIDEGARTCTVEPLNGDPEVFKVKLQADPDLEEGIAIIPAKDSTVIVSFLANNKAFVSLYSSIDKILIDTPEVIYNGGDNGGLINIEDLVAKLNNLENALNNHITAYNSHIHQAPQAPTGTIPTNPPQVPDSSNTISPTTQVSDLEDDKIKH